MESLLKREILMPIEKMTPEEDKEWGGIILWLLATDQEAHVSLSGEVRLRRSMRAEARRRKKEATERIAAAEAKRLRKMAKRMK
jgi:hypothetical protein